jgi:tRNA A-37 threonylcarbamoyl transferase component Bud32
MDADKRDERVEELLNKALERGPEERQAFLAQEGADDDTQLLIEVESLIRHHEANTVAKLDQPDWEGAGATLGGQPPGQRTVVGGKDAGARAESTTQLAAAFADHPRYRLLEPLGEGATGAVFKAEHRKMERTVALKVLKVQLVQGTDAIERFHREVKAAAKLNHPNIVTAFDADQQGDIHFLAMEYVRGLTLSKLLAKKGRLPVVHVCEFIRQAALGLQHAHENGMVHRDIKPGNLMITPQGQVKILDFGLARLAQDNQAPRRLTRFGTIMGTPDYVSRNRSTTCARSISAPTSIAWAARCTTCWPAIPRSPKVTSRKKLTPMLRAGPGRSPKSVATFP